MKPEKALPDILVSVIRGWGLFVGFNESTNKGGVHKQRPCSKKNHPDRKAEISPTFISSDTTFAN